MVWHSSNAPALASVDKRGVPLVDTLQKTARWLRYQCVLINYLATGIRTESGGAGGMVNWKMIPPRI